MANPAAAISATSSRSTADAPRAVRCGGARSRSPRALDVAGPSGALDPESESLGCTTHQDPVTVSVARR